MRPYKEMVVKIDYTKLFSYSLTKVCGPHDCVDRISFANVFVNSYRFLSTCVFFVKNIGKNVESVAFSFLV